LAGTIYATGEGDVNLYGANVNLAGTVTSDLGTIKVVAPENITISGDLSAASIQISDPMEYVAENVTIELGANLTATIYGITILATNNIVTSGDIKAVDSDVQLYADYDGDTIGEFSQLDGIIEATGTGDVYIDGSGSMTLGTISTEYGAIMIGTLQAPDEILGTPEYIHTQGDIEIIGKTQTGDMITLETSRGDVLRYSGQGNLTLEAVNGRISDLTLTPLPALKLDIIGNEFNLISSAISTEIYKNNGDIYITNAPIIDNQITLVGPGMNVTYFTTNDITLKSDGAVHTTEGVIIPGNNVQVIARYFGSTGIPLNIDAATTRIKMIEGNIDIRESLGIGTSITLRGPPEDGFGQI
ncbi:MAG: hypothetical protein Q8R48_05970, partial [Candidatus Omnitrophota bacterium]|nr:hypothetical protein [Candidatus Omnitrophota bacterium]